jgi:N-acetylmuramoyl-L-alanine amidase
MPAVLTENGFFSNKEECKKLLDNHWRQLIADAHFAAIAAVEKKGINF